MAKLVDNASPIEVWLSQPNIDIACTIVHEDETTEDLTVTSLSLRGAQREITGYLLSNGYQPSGRWETQATTPWRDVDTGDDLEGAGDPVESVRRFRYQPVPEPVWTSRDLVVLAAVAGVYDSGHTFDNLDQVAEALRFDRGDVGRSARVLLGDGLVDGVEAASIAGGDEDYDLLNPVPTGKGYRALAAWPAPGGLDGLIEFAAQQAAAAETPEERARWQRVRDTITPAAAAGAGLVNVLAAIKTLIGS